MQALSEFIRNHAEDIVAEWEQFARALQVGDATDVAALRDHAQQILDTIVQDFQ
jgi:hypothetical protein